MAIATTQLLGSTAFASTPDLKPPPFTGFLSYGLSATITPQRTLEVGTPQASMKIMDALGNVVKETPLPANGQYQATGAGGYSCINNTTATGFKIYPVQYATLDNVSIYLQFLFEPYSYDNARKITGQGYTFQAEYCSAGGSRPKENWRLMISGTSVAHTNTVPHIIGWKWQTGKTPQNISQTLGFEVGGGVVPIKITGSVTVTPVDINTGAQGASPFGSLETDKYPSNEVNAWWQGGCGFFNCGVGKDAYEGAVGHGLWEFPETPGLTVHLLGVAYAKIICNPAGYKCPQ